MGKATSIGQQAKEFYPEQEELDFRLAGCFQQLGKSIEMEYYSKTSIKKTMLLMKLYLSCFLHWQKKSNLL